MPGTSFDRVASIYDETRGGERRGDNFADDLAPWIVAPRVVELGVGTGVIAGGLRRHGIDVLGFDLSDAMMRAALDRVGPRVALADVDRLPIADDSLDSAYFVWVLQLVPDPIATLAEAARIVRPGGRVIAVLSNGEYATDDQIGAILDGLAALRIERLGQNEIAGAQIRGMSLEHEGFTSWDEFPSTVTEQIQGIENRIYSSMFDVDDASWAKVVEPVLAQLRALPDPDRPRVRRNRHPLLAWTVASGARPLM
ncbi:MAG TPA: class I SAM-dependent methyltransferase [Ilumatobacteraceae bacterium]|nr:class I SAM-dependent methyltransferase [Ilumatobacteraceae bacterium]